MHYTIEIPDPDQSPSGLCLPEQWKISQVEVEDPDGAALASTILTYDAPFQPASPSTYLADVALNLPNTQFWFSDLAGAAVGLESAGGAATTITLDTNAAGYGWFVDSMPADNTEFLPTSRKQRGQVHLPE